MLDDITLSNGLGIFGGLLGIMTSIHHLITSYKNRRPSLKFLVTSYCHHFIYTDNNPKNKIKQIMILAKVSNSSDTPLIPYLELTEVKIKSENIWYACHINFLSRETFLNFTDTNQIDLEAAGLKDFDVYRAHDMVIISPNTPYIRHIPVSISNEDKSNHDNIIKKATHIEITLFNSDSKKYKIISNHLHEFTRKSAYNDRSH